MMIVLASAARQFSNWFEVKHWPLRSGAAAGCAAAEAIASVAAPIDRTTRFQSIMAISCRMIFRAASHHEAACDSKSLRCPRHREKPCFPELLQCSAAFGPGPGHAKFVGVPLGK